MAVGELCNREVVITEKTASVVDAAQLMRTHHVGDLVVVEDRGGRKHPVGIVTDRDIVVEVVAAGVNPDSLKVGDIMGPGVATVRESEGLFGALRYEDDSFTDFRYQATASGGYGYNFINTERTKFEGQIGAGFRQTERRPDGEKSDDAIARGAINYQHKLTDTTLIYDRFLVESGSDNTFVQNALGIEVKINDTFALGLDYAVRHNTDVLPGTDKTDQVLTANLVYGF